MCGRTVCHQAPACICRAAGQRSGNGKWSQPAWRDPPGGQKYYPSYNQAPTSYTPILLSKKHLTQEEISNCSNLQDTENPVVRDDGVAMETEESDYVVQPMQWGLVPFWHQGEPKSTGYSMINARSDGMLEKRSFKVPLEKGRRCVVLLDGYYEWQKKGENKQPYFIYKPRSKVKEEDQKDVKVKEEVKSEDKGEQSLLMVAGLFDIWKNKEGEPLYTFSIITVDAHKEVSWIHDRMPAILKNDDEVRSWLDFSDVPLKKAVEVIRPVSDVQCHAVTKDVGNVHNKSPDLISPVDPDKKPKPTASSNFMAAWLGKSASKPEPSRKRSVSESDKKVVKTEVSVKSEVKEEGDQPSPLKKPKVE